MVQRANVLRRIILAVIAVLLVWFLWWSYVTWRDDRALSTGDVSSNDSADKPRKVPDLATMPSATVATTQSAPSSTQPIVYPATPSSVVSSTSPTADTISPNPPNGMVFAGTGHFQLYRQGNITWRVNTDDGRACILFATEAEWRKSKVFRNGCGAS